MNLVRVKYAWLFWVVCILLAVIFGFLSMQASNYILIGLTTLIGSYAAVRGLSMYAGKYPNEMYLA